MPSSTLYVVVIHEHMSRIETMFQEKRNFQSSLSLLTLIRISRRFRLFRAFGGHGVVVKAFGLYWGGIRFESFSSHHCWSLSKSFIPSLVVWSMTKNNAFGGEKQNEKSNGEQSDLCDLEKVALKPQLQVHHYLTTWLQIWYHSLLWGDSVRKGADFEKQNCLFGVHTAVMGKLTSHFSLFLFRLQAT